MSCSVCGKPERHIWPATSEGQKFDVIASENWMDLCRCASCGALWVGVGYEPYAMYIYFVTWERTEEEWHNEIATLKGASVHAWHKEQLKEHEHTLTDEDRKAIEHHRLRSSGRDPYFEA